MCSPGLESLSLRDNALRNRCAEAFEEANDGGGSTKGFP